MVSPPLGTTTMRGEYASSLCDPSEFVKVAFPGPDKDWLLSVQRVTAKAWEALAEVMTRHKYLFRESAGGTYVCRHIAGSEVYSLHSYGLALDINPSKNGPQGTSHCDMPQVMIRQIKAIHTGNGRLVFQWGGDWSPSFSDPMHFQIGALKSELLTGIIDPAKEDEDMPLTEAEMDKIADKVVVKLNAEGVKLARTDYNAQTLYANTVGEADKEPKGVSIGAQVRQILSIVSK